MANRSEKKDSIRAQIISAAQVYGTELAGRDFLYVFGDQYFQLRFKIECFIDQIKLFGKNGEEL